MRTRFLSFGFILTLGFLLLVSLTISTALAGIRGRVAASHPALVGAVGTPGWQRLAAAATHWALYLLILVMTLSSP